MIIDGYFSIFDMVQWTERVVLERLGPLQGREIPLFSGERLRHSPQMLVEGALLGGTLRSAAIIQLDGRLVNIQPRFWRRRYEIEKICEVDIGIEVSKERASAFHLALKGDCILVLDQNDEPRSAVFGMPIVAMADVARWAGADSLPSPTEYPAEWGELVTAAPLKTPKDRAMDWVAGFAEALCSVAPHSKLKRDDPEMTAACKAATGCTTDDVRAASAALPLRLRNPKPTERGAASKNVTNAR